MSARIIKLDKNWYKQERAPIAANTAVVTKKKAIPAKFYTVREVAERLNIGVDAVYDYTYRGWLKFQRVGRSKRISEEALLDFLYEQNLRKI